MPVTYIYRDQTLEILSVGKYTPQDVFDVYDEAIRKEHLRPPTPVLINATRTANEPSAMQIQEIAARYTPLLEFIGPHFAIVVADDLRYGLGRMFGMFAEMEGCVVRVFRDEAEARDWLQSVQSG